MGAYPLVAGQRKAAELAKALKAKVVVPMNNGDIDLGGSRLPLDVRACIHRVSVLCEGGTHRERPISSINSHAIVHRYDQTSRPTNQLKRTQRMIKKSGTMAEFQRLLREVCPSALVKEAPPGEAVTI